MLSDPVLPDYPARCLSPRRRRPLPPIPPPDPDPVQGTTFSGPPHEVGGSRDRRTVRTDEALAYRLAMQEAHALRQVEEDRELALHLQNEEDEDVEDYMDVLTDFDYDTRPPTPDAGRLQPLRRTRTVSWTEAVIRRERLRSPIPVRIPDVQRNTQIALRNARLAARALLGSLVASTSAMAISLGSKTADAFMCRIKVRSCVTCMERIRGAVIRAPCNHFYDKECIEQLFAASTRDESLFPPRCCRRYIPIELVRRHLSRNVVAAFEERKNELGTLKRVYCAKPTCSRFLGPQWEDTESRSPQLIAPQFRCTAQGCNTITCALCKDEIKRDQAHRCGDNDTDELVLALARDAGWARCPGCATMIELNHGCYHMTCRCKTQFCYLCQARWKTCSCQQWEERRLVAAAEIRADAQLRREEAEVGGEEALELEREFPFLLTAARRHPENVPANGVRGDLVLSPAQRRIASLRAAFFPQQMDRGGWRLGPIVHNLANPDFGEHADRDGGLEGGQVPVAERGGARESRQGTPVLPPLELPPRQLAPRPLFARSRGETRYSPSPSSTPLPSSSSSSRSISSASVSSSSISMPLARRRSSTLIPSRRDDLGEGPSRTIPVSPLRISRTAEVDFERRNTLIQLWMERLNHECTHERWTFHSALGACDVCGDQAPPYVFRCEQCDHIVCGDCRRNRG